MHLCTPLIDMESRHLAPGRRVRLKMDCWQPAGSFKIRGVGHLCSRSVERGADHLVASSGGNAGVAVSWAGRELGVRVTVVVPESTSGRVRDHLSRIGAEVVVHGVVWDQADERARQLAAEPGACYIPPFDHPEIWEGHASLVKECAEQGERPGCVVLSVGGGGLLCGVLQGMQEVGWNEVPMVAVETEGAASLKAAMDSGGPVEIDGIQSLAKTLGALRVADEAWRWTTRHPVESLLVSDGDAVDACLRFADDHRCVVEPACGAALAAVYQDRVRADDVLVIVCGGSGASLADLEGWAGELGLRADADEVVPT